MTAPSKDQDALFQGWQGRIEDLLENEIHLLNYHQDLFTQVRDDAVQRYPEPSFAWVVHYAHLYAHRQAVALRRVCEKQSEVRSLYSLIDSIKRNIEVLSVHRYEAMALERDLPQTLRFNLDSSGKGHIDPEEVEQSLKALKETSSRTKEFVDTTIAHRDPGGDGLLARGERSLTYAEIHEGIEIVSSEAVKWHLYLNGVHAIPKPIVPRTWKWILMDGFFHPSV